ncbi:MAG TPA: amino acid adenylation domain-containing protein, partial [Terriglobales bacterium]|nr:amino acid adenylation domain-containing protein [Terriglobales bacterium]
MNRRANQLGHYLRKQGVGPEVRVGVCMERSLEMVVALLGVLKAGGAYVPLDPSFPAERVRYMIADSHAPIILTQSKLYSLWPQSEAQVICVDEQWEQIASESPENPVNLSAPENLVYVIYTSGSTGNPKGVMIGQRNLLNILQFFVEQLEIGAADTLLATTTISFDIAALELFCPLLAGGRLAIASTARGEMESLAARMQQVQGTIVQGTPTLWKAILEQDWGAVAGRVQVLCGGEALDWSTVERLREVGGKVWNVYGPTETTVWSSIYGVQAGSEGVVPIGRPIANTQLYVLDAAMAVVPVGVAGELYVGGTGVARGYLNRPELTAEKFVPDPFGGAGGRLYRTGDRVRWNPGGEVEFLGRADYQVKIRGYRIELGEIEALLQKHAAVEQAVVIVREDRPGEKRLVGYAALKTEAEGTEVSELRNYLAEHLPEYMRPAALVLLPALPATPNGKVDRKALPRPEMNTGRESLVGSRNAVEEILCGIWKQVLGVQRDIGIHENFFELGGHSLLATRVISLTRQLLKADVPVRALFEAPTVEQFAKHVARAGNTRPSLVLRSRPQHLPLSYAQQRLWFIDQLEAGRSTEYNMPRTLRLGGDLDLEALKLALNAMRERHESLRTRFGVVEGEPVQIIDPPSMIDLPEEDISGLDNAVQKEHVLAAMRREWETPFDLANGPLFRLKLIKLSDRDHVIVLNFHHIISDGWSQDIFNREFVTLYQAFHNGHANPLTRLPLQYADYAVWQREWLTESVLRDQLDYWRQALAGIPEELEFPKDRPRQAVQTYAADACTAILPGEQVAALKQLSQENHSTLYMSLLAAFAALLQ